MENNFKRILLGVGVVVASMSMLTACHTIQGTVQGAGQDVRSVTNTVTESPAEERREMAARHHHRVMHKHKKVVKKTTTTENNADQNAPTTQQNTTTQTTTTDTNKSY